MTDKLKRSYWLSAEARSCIAKIRAEHGLTSDTAAIEFALTYTAKDRTSTAPLPAPKRAGRTAKGK